jgi:hypothetical protein
MHACIDAGVQAGFFPSFPLLASRDPNPMLVYIWFFLKQFTYACFCKPYVCIGFPVYRRAMAADLRGVIWFATVGHHNRHRSTGVTFNENSSSYMINQQDKEKDGPADDSMPVDGDVTLEMGAHENSYPKKDCYIGIKRDPQF